MNLTHISALNYEGRPESKDRLRIKLAEVVHHVFHTWPQVIFTCSEHRRRILGWQTLQKRRRVKYDVKQWLNGLRAGVYDEDIDKLVTRYEKCLNVDGECVEKIT